MAKNNNYNMEIIGNPFNIIVRVEQDENYIAIVVENPESGEEANLFEIDSDGKVFYGLDSPEIVGLYLGD